MGRDVRSAPPNSRIFKWLFSGQLLAPEESMILVVTSSPRASECAAAIEKTTGERAQVCPSLKSAAKAIRHQECSALVLDQVLLEADPAAADVVLNDADTAIPVFVNLAITSSERLLADVRAALRRREKERVQATREAESLLRSQLSEALTGILLSSQLALAVPALPSAAQARMRSVYQLAMAIRHRLEPVN